MNKNFLIKLGFLLLFCILSAQFLAYAVKNNIDMRTSSITAETPNDDEKITRTIRTLIKERKTLSHLNIKVNTHKGVVNLSGNLASNTQLVNLVELVQSVIGVVNVDTSKLIIKSSKQPLSDMIITAKIKGLLIREKLFGEKDIAAIETSIETKDNIVYMSGVFDNQNQINNAIEIIKKYIPEVKEIEYTIKK